MWLCPGMENKLAYIENRYVLSAVLKAFVEALSRSCCGRVFQARGAATANKRRPKFVEVAGTIRSQRSNDLRRRRRRHDDTCQRCNQVRVSAQGQGAFCSRYNRLKVIIYFQFFIGHVTQFWPLGGAVGQRSRWNFNARPRLPISVLL